jgi:hypothetical protein
VAGQNPLTAIQSLLGLSDDGETGGEERRHVASVGGIRCKVLGHIHEHTTAVVARAHICLEEEMRRVRGLEEVAVSHHVREIH